MSLLEWDFGPSINIAVFALWILQGFHLHKIRQTPKRLHEPENCKTLFSLVLTKTSNDRLIKHKSDQTRLLFEESDNCFHRFVPPVFHSSKVIQCLWYGDPSLDTS